MPFSLQPQKPELKVDLELRVPENHAECFDEHDNFLAAVAFPTKPPPGTRRIRVGPEIYFSLMRRHGGIGTIASEE